MIPRHDVVAEREHDLQNRLASIFACRVPPARS
jgi:hypothetical protein